MLVVPSALVQQRAAPGALERDAGLLGHATGRRVRGRVAQVQAVQVQIIEGSPAYAPGGLGDGTAAACRRQDPLDDLGTAVVEADSPRRTPPGAVPQAQPYSMCRRWQLPD